MLSQQQPRVGADTKYSTGAETHVDLAGIKERAGEWEEVGWRGLLAQRKTPQKEEKGRIKSP